MQRWKSAQQIGLLSYVLTGCDPHKLEWAAEVEERLLESLKSQEWHASRHELLCSLPLSSLTLLDKAVCHSNATSNLCGMQEEVTRAINFLAPPDRTKGSGRAKPTRLDRIEVWVAHTLLSRTDSDVLLRLGDRLFFDGWAVQGERISSKLEDSLEVLRDPGWTTTPQRCEAIGRFTSFFRTVPMWIWAQIENRLYHHQFFWPLVVYSGQAVSLPVAVELEYDSNSQDPLRIEGTDGPVAVRMAREQLRRCVDIGKKLWLAKHGNYGSLKDRVKSSRTVITFDFSDAQDIAAPLQARSNSGEEKIPVAVEEPPFGISDESADAYFAQAALSRLLGRTPIWASTATGSIGERVRSRKTGQKKLDYHFDEPAGLSAKLDFAFASRMFERVVLPRGAENTLRTFLKKSGNRQTAEMPFAGRMQKVADIMQVRGWRRHRYVRCPDIAWRLHHIDYESKNEDEKRPGLTNLTPDEDARVQETIQRLQENEQKVCTFNVSPHVLAASLWHLNIYKRRDIYPRPPMFSWAFVRAREEEQDVRFWELIWDVLDAPAEGFEKFIREPNRDRATERLADAMNMFSPSLPRRSHRAPDILVIIGTKVFEDSLKETLNPQSRSFSVVDILGRLARPGFLKGPFKESLGSLIGKTRIICIPTEEQEVAPSSLKGLTQKDIYVIQLLSVFESGFTQHMADLMLSGDIWEDVKYSGEELRKRVLKPLVIKGGLREAIGKYHVPQSVRERISEIEERSYTLKQKALLHYKAGGALAPYVTATKIPALATDTAFNPQYIHEAEYHFNQALELAREANDGKIEAAARRALHHLFMYLSPPSWSLVCRQLSIGLNAYALENAERLIDWEKSANEGEVHPNHWWLAARAAWYSAKEYDREERYQTADEYYQNALNSCRYFPSEYSYNRLLALSHYYGYLKECAPDQIDATIEKAHKTLLASDLLNSGQPVKGIWGEFIEQIGDVEKGPAQAADIYRKGTHSAEGWAQLWIKALGAADLAEQQNRVQSVRNEISTSERAKSLLSNAKRACLSAPNTADAYVLDRWHRGVTLFNEFWGFDSRVSQLAHEMTRHLR